MEAPYIPPGPRVRARLRLPGRGRGVVVGLDETNPMTAAQVRAVLDRVNARWTALKVAALTLAPEDIETRRAFLRAWSAWRTFYEEARHDWLAWGTNVLQAQEFDREADAWRIELTALGVTVADPTASTTGDPPASSLPWWALAIGGGALVGLYLYAKRDAGGGVLP